MARSFRTRLCGFLLPCLFLTTPGCSTPDPPATVAQATIKPRLKQPPIDQALWRSYRQRSLADAPKENTLVKAVTAAVAAVNRAEVHSLVRGVDRSFAQDAYTTLREVAWRYARQTSALHYMRLGRSLSIKMIDDLIVFRRDCTALNVSLQDCLSDHTLRRHPYVASGGTLVHLMALAKPTPPDSIVLHPALAVGIFMQRWARLITDKTSIDSYLGASERRWFLRWRGEFDPFATTLERLAAFEELSAIKAYPAAWNTVIVLMEDNMWIAARTFAASQMTSDMGQLIKIIDEHIQSTPKP